MAYWVAGVDVHKKVLAVVITDVTVEGEFQFTRRRFGTNPSELRAARDQAIQQAITAYGAAKSTLGQVKYRGLQRELTALVATLERAESTLSGAVGAEGQ